MGERARVLFQHVARFSSVATHEPSRCLGDLCRDNADSRDVDQRNASAFSARHPTFSAGNTRAAGRSRRSTVGRDALLWSGGARVDFQSSTLVAYSSVTTCEPSRGLVGFCHWPMDVGCHFFSGIARAIRDPRTRSRGAFGNGSASAHSTLSAPPQCLLRHYLETFK